MPKRGCKNRKLKGILTRERTFVFREDRLEKLDELAGRESRSAALEYMIDHYYERAIKKHLLPLNLDSSS